MILEFSSRPNVITRIHYHNIILLRGDRRVSEDGRIRAEVREERRCCAAGFEAGGRGCEPRNTNNLQKLEKAKK